MKSLTYALTILTSLVALTASADVLMPTETYVDGPKAQDIWNAQQEAGIPTTDKTSWNGTVVGTQKVSKGTVMCAKYAAEGKNPELVTCKVRIESDAK